MSTDKQKNANRENAQHSTGPNTEEGKEISSFNRFKHGLCGRFVMIAGESQQDFNRLRHLVPRRTHTRVTTEETVLDQQNGRALLAQPARSNPPNGNPQRRSRV